MNPLSSSTTVGVHGFARIAFLVVTGALGGLMSGLFGIGGGIVMVPLMIWMLRMTQRQASATSLVAIVPSAVVGAASYMRAGDVDFAAAGLIAVGGIAGSLIGTRMLRTLPLPVLRWGFVALLVAVAAQTALEVPSRDATIEVSVVAAFALVGMGLLMGVASGLFGIGGGLIAVPGLVIGFGAGDVLAKGTSLLAMIPTALVGTASNIHRRNVRALDGVVVGLAAVPTSIAGVQLAYLVEPRVASMLLAALVLAAAAQLAWRAWRKQRPEASAAPVDS